MEANAGSNATHPPLLLCSLKARHSVKAGLVDLLSADNKRLVTAASSSAATASSADVSAWSVRRAPPSAPWAGGTSLLESASLGRHFRHHASVDDSREGSGQDEVVILVHGTFAGDRNGSDTGSRWWQRGSDTWRWLEENLPPGAVLPREGQLFHWSGANTQSARLSAATDLLALLIDLEKQGRAYHLVGHSHGGSVI